MEQIKIGGYRCHYHLIINIILLFFILSCDRRNKESVGIEKDKTYIKSRNAKKIDELRREEIREKEEDTISKNKVKELAFLKEKGIISKDFIYNNNVAFLESYNLNGLTYNLIKIVYDATIGDIYLEDPYIIFIYVKREDELKGKIDLYSIEEEDVRFAFKLNNNIYFEQYDSATGWKKYYTFLTDKLVFVETNKLDESEIIIRESINLTDLTFKTNLNEQLKSITIKNK